MDPGRPKPAACNKALRLHVLKWARRKKDLITMRKHLSLAAAAAMLVSMPLAAQAFPVASSPAGSDPQVTLVAGGCGIGFHRGPLGGCRASRVIVRRPAVIVRRRPFIVRRPFVCRVVGLIPHRVCRRW